MHIVVALALTLVGLMAHSASAEPITFRFTGRITGVDLQPGVPFAGLVAINDPFSGTVSFDSRTFDTNPDPAHGIYFATGSFKIRFGAFQSPGSRTQFRIDVTDDFQGEDRFQVTSETGVDVLTLSMVALADLGAITSDALPVIPPDAGRFELPFVSFIDLQHVVDGSPGGIAGRLDSISTAAPIPEPATLTLLALGTCASIAARRKRS